MNNITVHTRRFHFAMAHSVMGADPASPAAYTHAHQCELIIESATVDHFVSMERWLKDYVLDRELSKSFDFPTTQARLAKYLADVFAQFDARLISVELIFDNAHGAIARPDPTVATR